MLRIAPTWIICTVVASSTPPSAASGMTPTTCPATSTNSSRIACVGEGRQSRAGAGAHVDGGAGDRGGGRHPAEQRHDEVRQPLPEQLAVGIVLLPDAHRVGDGRAEQALQRGQRRHGQGGRQQRRHPRRVKEVCRRCRDAGGQGADEREVEPASARRRRWPAPRPPARAAARA